MIQLVFVFGVVLPTLVTVACFIGFLVCWFRFRSLKRRRHVTDRKLSVGACPRRCRVHVKSSSSSAVDVGTCVHPTARCFWPPTGSSIIPTGSRIPDGWTTRGRNSVVLPPTRDAVDIDMPSAATVKMRCPETLIKRADSRGGSSRTISGLRASTTSPGSLLMHQYRRRNVSAFGESARARTMHCLSSAGALKPEVYISGCELRRKGEGAWSWSRAMNVDSCYVEVEPTLHAAACPPSCRRMTVSRSADHAVAKATPTTASGLSHDRKYYGENVAGKSVSGEVARRPSQTRRHRSLTEVAPHHRRLQVKTDDHITSLDF